MSTGRLRRVSNIELIIRSAGGLLQIAGVITIAMEVWSSQVKYGEEEPLPSRFWSAVRRFFSREKPATAQAVAIGTAVESEGVGELRALTGPKGLTLEEQVEELFRRWEYLRRDLETAKSVGAEAREKLNQQMSEERERRTQAVRVLQEQHDELATSNIRVRWVGVGLFLFGVAGTTWSQELARLVA